MGVVILVALFLSLTSAYVVLGGGGSERLIVYPEIIWTIGLGTYLMSVADGQEIYQKHSGKAQGS